MNEWIQGLQPGQWLILVPTLAFLEACVGLGLFVSGIFLVSVSALIYASGEIDLWALVCLAYLGAMTGDHSGYWLGRLLGPRFWQLAWLKKYNRQTLRISELLLKSAPAAICVGRLSPLLRSITPAIAGVSGLSWQRFILFDALACALWCTGLTLILLGVDSL